MTFLEYVNICLQGINEVALTPEQLNSARGLHQFAKEAVNRAYFDIISEAKWPWMQNSSDEVTLGTLELSGERSVLVTSQWMPLPLDNPYADSLDWSSIYYRDSENLRYPLAQVTWEEYEDKLDFIEGMNKDDPKLIVQSADGRSMGIFPVPETSIGRLYYRIWARPSRYSLSTDVVNLPDADYNVLIDGALAYLSTFRSDGEAANIEYLRYEKGIKRMRRKYGNQGTRLRWA